MLLGDFYEKSIEKFKLILRHIIYQLNYFPIIFPRTIGAG